MNGLSRRNNALSDRMERASSSSFPESSATRFCDFSSHFMALATHMSLSLGESLHHSLQLCVHGIPVADQLVSRFLRSGTLLLLLLHVLSSATSCTVSCFRTVSATIDTDFSFVALIIWTSRARDNTVDVSWLRRTLKNQKKRKETQVETKNGKTDQKMTKWEKGKNPQPWTPKVALRPSGVFLVNSFRKKKTNVMKSVWGMYPKLQRHRVPRGEQSF